MKDRPSSNYFIHEGVNCKRVFLPITSLARDLRPFLSYGRKPLWDIDISCALPTLFNIYLVNQHYNDVKEYRYLTSDNCDNYGLYDYLGELWNVDDREEVKVLTMVLLFGRGNTIRELRSKFEKAFPTVYKSIKKLKRESYKVLASLLMNLEREIMIDCVVDSLIQENEDMPLWTIHDGMLTTEEFGQIIKTRIQKEINDRIGIIPKVKIKAL